MFRPLSRSRKHQVVMCYAPYRFYLQKQVEEAQIVVDKTMQELKEIRSELASRRLEVSGTVRMYRNRQISRLITKEKSLRRCLYLKQIDQSEKQAKLRFYDQSQAIKPKLDTIKKEVMDLESAIKFHKKALKKAKKAEDKDAHNLKIADLEQEYKKMCREERKLSAEHFKLERALGLR
ncbi:hypothetical protein GUITHDRAFT_118913 [Guillardia theta CCMP2712]|uniref:Uncharacterized protein n=1 Tax=Guillardia theta (strain CCMP2712) TaxID=905079 RepID=L1IF76_GUITC|nr:hypothetical protein GUITHDRAFT_118913 [Guillardia theta CCMP2712]EKX34873.1 hypothetical protein GUITHDRAFT_118913 [Guillardia theta CCMP2712]|eukprot:XP_005821853.1 hypothetical protein GUITHDRAFT_118913 [Guillardia theta CCMP2712]